MRPRPRLRKTAKWAGVAVCAVIAAALAWSTVRFFAVIRYRSASGGEISGAVFGADNGCLMYQAHERLSEMTPVGFDGSTSKHEFRLTWWFRQVTRPSLELVLVPLWVPFLLFASPTAFLWRRDHILTKRAKAGRCQKCNYDRAGLAPAAPCPECGGIP